MEPIDDILIPRTRSASEAPRVRTRHLVRMLAMVLILLSIAYAVACLRLDALASRRQRLADLMGVAPVLFFGLCLWWYGGRKLPELGQPLFKKDSGAGSALGWRSGFWGGACLLAGFIGLVAVTLGATLALRGEELKIAFPLLKQMNLPISPILTIGTLLLVMAAVAFMLAKRKAAAGS